MRIIIKLLAKIGKKGELFLLLLIFMLFILMLVLLAYMMYYGVELSTRCYECLESLVLLLNIIIGVLVAFHILVKEIKRRSE